jgi:hypothetical protein
MMSSCAADAATALGLDQQYPQFRHSISCLSMLSAVTISSEVELNNIELLKQSDSYKLLSQKILVIFEAMSVNNFVNSGIDQSPCAAMKELITSCLHSDKNS